MKPTKYGRCADTHEALSPAGTCASARRNISERIVERGSKCTALAGSIVRSKRTKK